MQTEVEKQKITCCTLCKTTETSKWLFSVNNDVLYCIMCFYHAKTIHGVNEDDMYEVFTHNETNMDSIDTEIYEFIDV